MTYRFLNDSKSDFDNLLDMFTALEEKQGVSHLTYVLKLIELLNIQDGKCFIFENGNNIVGFAIIYPDLKGGCIGQSLYIKPEFRGTASFFNCLTILKDYVASKYAYVDLVATNDVISKLYEKLGYQKLYTIYRHKET